MYKIVFLRHGESVWNKENYFTGWTDVDLSEKGVEEAHKAGKILKEEGYQFDVAYTSVLKRAIKTLNITLEELDELWIPVYKSWRLNERHYGDLQGLNKAETSKKLGQETVHKWRRSYDIPPPELDVSDKRYPGNERKYSDLTEDQLPKTECLKDTLERCLPYWKETIVPMIKTGKKVMVAAHGNSLRAIVKYLDKISDDEISGLNIPTGIPLVYELDEDLKPIKHYYLGDPDEIAKATKAVANQAKAK